MVPQCNQRVVIEELNKFLGCTDDVVKRKEDSSITANRWVGFMRRLAIEMSVSTPLGNNDVGHTAADAVGATLTLNLTHASSYADTYRQSNSTRIVRRDTTTTAVLAPS